MHLLSSLSGVALIFGAVALPGSALADTKTFVSDQGHTEVLFGWDHVGITTQNGEFTQAVATVKLEENLEQTVFESTVILVILTEKSLFPL